jgi:hypothetical protein
MVLYFSWNGQRTNALNVLYKLVKNFNFWWRNRLMPECVISSEYQSKTLPSLKSPLRTMLYLQINRKSVKAERWHLVQPWFSIVHHSTYQIRLCNFCIIINHSFKRHKRQFEDIRGEMNKLLADAICSHSHTNTIKTRKWNRISNKQST